MLVKCELRDVDLLDFQVARQRFHSKKIVDLDLLTAVYNFTFTCCCTAFSALTLLVGRQEGHPACKKLSGGVLASLSIWSDVQICIWPS